MSGKVFDELTCPDCGGRIGLVSADAPPGTKPCTCFAERKPSRAPRRDDEPDPADMTPFVPVAGSPSGGRKLCRICKRDLTGRARLKDEKGYICKKCSDAEYEAEYAAELDKIECPECHRKLGASAFLEYRGTLICKRCHSHHLDNDTLKVAKLGALKLHEKHDRKKLITMSIVAGVLAIALLVKTVVWGW